MSVSPLFGQTISNTSWKTYIGDPVNDTLTIHIKTDSSFVTTTGGAVVVRSLCKLSGDTLSLSDYDGQYACPNMTGRYKIALKGDELSFVLIDDPCEGRAQSLSGLKWKKVP